MRQGFFQEAAMATETYLLIACAVIAGAFLIHRFQIAARQYWKLSGKMLVTCPETRKTEAVEIAAGHAAAAAVVGPLLVELNACTRWPERKDCDQDCLGQLESDPEQHSVWNIASDWYAGKNCVFCNKPIQDLNHFDHRPALLTLEGKAIEWDEIRPQDLPGMLTYCQPVCWNCCIVQNFRRGHAELVVERPGRC
jgi:hypothetical protein